MILNHPKIGIVGIGFVGGSHLRVPGPDESFGFGGACFPKDTAALLKIAEDYNVQLNVLDTAVKKNTLLRLTEPK